jgi:hypothetical protein
MLQLSLEEIRKIENVKELMLDLHIHLTSLNRVNRMSRLTTLKKRSSVEPEESESSEVDETRVSSSKKSRSSHRGKGISMKSRNSVINEWLAAEGAYDNYADLEDFIAD